jgi:hypothetical protein
VLDYYIVALLDLRPADFRDTRVEQECLCEDEPCSWPKMVLGQDGSVKPKFTSIRPMRGKSS